VSSVWWAIAPLVLILVGVMLGYADRVETGLVDIIGALQDLARTTGALMRRSRRAP
jgi:hypothetical protein